MILKLNLKTPGEKMMMRKRSYIQKLIIKQKVDGNDADSENEMTPEDQKSALITRGLGGKKTFLM